MGFKNAVVAGTVLVRPAIQSPNYVPGLAGWSINVDGTAEFLDLNIRGQFSTGPAGSQHVAINDNSGIARVELWSGDPQEISPLFLANFVNGGISFGQLDSSDDGQGVISIGFLAPQAGQPGIWFFFNSGTVSPAIVEYDTDVAQLLLNTNGESLASTNHPLQIGPGGASNLRFDYQSIEAVNNGAAAPLFLNFNGGNVNIGGGAANGGLIAPKMAAAEFFGTTAGPSTASVTPAWVAPALAAGGVNGTFPYPPSGAVKVHLSARDIVNSAGGGNGLMSVRIRDTNAAGTIRYDGTTNPYRIIDGNAIETTGTRSRSMLATGLPVTGTAYIELVIAVSVAGTTTAFTRPSILVEPST